MEERDLVLKRAKNAVLSRDFSLALRIYNSLLKEDPENKEYLSAVGNIYEKTNSDAMALGYFQKILKNSPNDFEALNHTGGIYRRLKMYNEAIEVLKKALATGKNTSEVNYNLGFTYKTMGKNQEAIECFEQVISENPSDVLAYNHLGSIYYQKRDYIKSISTYKLGLQIDSNHPILQYNLAKSYEAIKDEQNAVKSYETALRAKPGWIDAVKDYASLLIRQNKTKPALDLVQNSLELHSGRDDLKILEAKIYYYQCNYQEAEKILDILSRKNRPELEAFALLAIVREAKGKYNEAAQAIVNAEEICPEEHLFRITEIAAGIMLSAKRFEEAHSRIVILSDNRNFIPSLDLQGQMAICTGREENLDSLRAKIIGSKPDYHKFYTNWGYRFLQKGKYNEAKKYFKKHIELNRKAIMDWLYLGTADERLGYFESAAEDFNMALNIDPANFLAKRNLDRVTSQMQDFDTGENQERDDILSDVEPESLYDFQEDEFASSENDDLSFGSDAYGNENGGSADGISDDFENPGFSENGNSDNANEENKDENGETDEPSLKDISSGEDADIFSLDDSVTPADESKSLSQELLEGEELSDFGFEMPEEENDEEPEEDEEEKTPEIHIDIPGNLPENYGQKTEKEDNEAERAEDKSGPENAENGSENGGTPEDSGNEDISGDSENSENGEELSGDKTGEELNPDENKENPLQNPFKDFEEDGSEAALPPYDENPAQEENAAEENAGLQKIPQNQNPGNYRNPPYSSPYNYPQSSDRLPYGAEQQLNEALDKAQKAAEKAWQAAQNAADAAHTVDKAEDFINKMTEDAAKKLQDAANDIQNKIDGTKSPKEPPQENQAADEDSGLRKSEPDQAENGSEINKEGKDSSAENENPYADGENETQSGNPDKTVEPGGTADSGGAQKAESGGTKTSGANAPHAVSSGENEAIETLEALDTESLSEQIQSISNEALSAQNQTYAKLLKQVEQVLPLVENMLVNKEDSARFRKEVALFSHLKELGDFLPSEQKQMFMTSRMRVLLDFLIAKLSGKPGLLRTTDSLRKSGVFENLDQALLEKVSPEYENADERDLMKKVISDMRKMTSSLNDKNLAEGLENLAKEAEDKL